jgi:general secretion pathway protein C
MLDARIHDWLSRLPRNGPWLVTLLLAALIAVELARMLISLLGASPLQSVEPVPAQTARVLQDSRVNVQSIMGAHLFGIANAPSGAQDPANAPLSSANLVLAGTIATQDPKHGVAIISDGGPSKVYTVGDRIGGAALHSVYLDHVILDRAGALETLVLPRALTEGKQLPPRRIAADANTAASVDNLRRMVQQDPSLLSEVIRTVASYDNKAGKLRGFRVYPGRNRQAFAGLGLKPGDLVTAINGTPLDDPQHGQEIMNTIQTSDRATVTIERAGQSQDMSLNIAQVAAEATKDIAAAPTTPTTPTTPVAPAATGESSAPAPNGANNGQPAAEAAAPPPANSD